MLRVAVFAYGGSYLCRLGSGELWCMVGDLRIFYAQSEACMHGGLSLVILNTRLAPRGPGEGGR